MRADRPTSDPALGPILAVVVCALIGLALTATPVFADTAASAKTVLLLYGDRCRR